MYLNVTERRDGTRLPMIPFWRTSQSLTKPSLQEPLSGVHRVEKTIAVMSFVHLEDSISQLDHGHIRGSLRTLRDGTSLAWARNELEDKHPKLSARSWRKKSAR